MGEGVACDPLSVTGGGWSDGTLTGVHINFLVVMRDVARKQTYPEEAEHIDQFGLPAIDKDLRTWVRQEQDAAAAVISNRKNLPESTYKHESAFDREGRTLLLQDGFVRSVFTGENRSCSGRCLISFASHRAC